MHHRILGLLVYTFLTAFILFSAGQMMQFKYAEKRFNTLIDKHNYGFLLVERRQVKLALSTAKILFYFKLPPRTLDLSNIDVNCSSIEGLNSFDTQTQNNETDLLWERICVDLTNLLASFHLVKVDALRHYAAKMEEVYGMLADTDVALRGKGKRGIWGDGWSWFLDLPSTGDLKKLQDQIDTLLPAVRAASKAWSTGTSQFISAIQVQEKRVNALYELLNITRSSLRVFNQDILEIVKERNVRSSLIGLVITTLKKKRLTNFCSLRDCRGLLKICCVENCLTIFCRTMNSIERCISCRII